MQRMYQPLLLAGLLLLGGCGSNGGPSVPGTRPGTGSAPVATPAAGSGSTTGHGHDWHHDRYMGTGTGTATTTSTPWDTGSWDSFTWE